VTPFDVVNAETLIASLPAAWQHAFNTGFYVGWVPLTRGFFMQKYGQTCVVRAEQWPRSPILDPSSTLQLPSIILIQWLPGSLETGTSEEAIALNTTAALSFLFNGPTGFRVMRNAAYDEIGWQHNPVDGCDIELDQFYASGCWSYLHLAINMSANLIDSDIGMESLQSDQLTPTQPVNTEEWVEFAVFFKIWQNLAYKFLYGVHCFTSRHFGIPS